LGEVEVEVEAEVRLGGVVVVVVPRRLHVTELDSLHLPSSP